FKVMVKAGGAASTRRVTFSLPSSLVARVAKLSPIRRFGADLHGRWDSSDITPRQILDAAGQSAPGKPGVIKKEDHTIEVTAEGSALDIVVRDDWGKTVHVRMPRAIVDRLPGDREIPP